jgi:hypothetical protein
LKKQHSKIYRISNSVLMAVVLIGMLFSTFQKSLAEDSQPSEPYTGTAVCLPEAYIKTPVDCLALGPSQTLTTLAQQGISYPPRPLFASHPPRELTTNPVNIARLNLKATEPGFVYGTLDDAVAGNNPVRQIAPGEGLRYVSYVQTTDVDGHHFVQLKTGEWMRASPSGYSYFQGLLFSKTPSNSFGWVIDRIYARQEPSWNAPEVGDLIQQNTVVQIYEEAEAEGMHWFRIGTDQWVPFLKSRRVTIDTNPPAGVTGDRWISVDLYNQTMSVYDKRQLVFSTLIASGGKPFYTRPGLFKIYKKKPLETMSGAFETGKTDYYYLEDVPWTMYFDQARALHGAYWRPWFGVAGTHGCVNLSIGDAAWLYQWANEGDPVYVWDPSGETPVDPSLYGAGGA